MTEAAGDVGGSGVLGGGGREGPGEELSELEVLLEDFFFLFLVGMLALEGRAKSIGFLKVLKEQLFPLPRLAVLW